jgi:hypothetical protein
MSSPTLHFDSAHAATKHANRIVYPALDGLRAVASSWFFYSTIFSCRGVS